MNYSTKHVGLIGLGRVFPFLAAIGAFFLMQDARANLIGDFVWEDLNTNGVQDVGEPGLAGIPINLYDASSNFVGATATDSNGFYAFTENENSLTNATYFLAFQPAPTFPYFVTTNGVGSEESDSDIDPGGNTQPFTYTLGVAITNIDAGYVKFQPGIEVIKIASDGPRIAPDGTDLYVTNGTWVTYTYTITNSGNSYLSFVQFIDEPLFPFGPGENPLLVLCPDNFAPGEVITFTTSVVINASITNIATVEAFPVDFKTCTFLDLDPVNDTDDAVVLLSRPGSTIEKTWTSPTNRQAAVGEAVQFRVDVVNTGNVELATVPLEDIYDTNYLAFASAVPSADDSVNDGLINWSNIVSGPLAVGGTATVYVTFTAVQSTAGLETNIAIAYPTTTTNFPGSVPPVTNDAPYDIVDPSVDVVKTLVNPSGRPAAVGETNVFTITISNTGDYNLDVVPVVDTYNVGLLSYLGADPASVDNVDDGILNWTNVGPLLVGQSTVITTRFVAVDSGSGINVARSEPSTTNGVPVPPDEDPEGFTNVNPSVSIVKILNSPNGRPAGIGETNEFIITVQNTGDIVLDTVPVVDTFPTSLLDYIPVGNPQPDSTAPAGTLTWTNVGPLAPSQITNIIVRFIASAAGSGTNIAQSAPSTTNGIPVPPDEDPEGFTNVNPVVVVTKTLVSPAGRPAAIGETNVFLITVTNAGDTGFATVPLEDTYDTFLMSYLSADPASDDNVDDGTINWADLGALNVGGSITVTTRFVAVTNGIGTNVVTAAPTSTNGVPVPPDEDDEGYTNVNPRVSIVKTLVSPAGRAAIVGETNVFIITIENIGDVTLDTVPASDFHGTGLVESAFISPSADGGGPEGFAWTNLGPLAVGESITITTGLRAVSAGIGTNFVSTTPTTTNGIPVPRDEDPEGYTNVTIFIGDTVWIDLNTNGVPDENLNLYGLNGITVNLYRVDGVVSNLIDTRTTQAGFGQQGYYSFTGLPYGVYSVAIDPFSVPPLLTVYTTPTSYRVDPNDIGFPADGVVDDADFGLQSGSLTPIELESFTARRTDDGVLVEWVTSVEFESLGFNIYRAEIGSEAQRIMLNDRLIPAVGGDQGAGYSLTDSAPVAEKGYLYWLEEIATYGDAELYGPVAVHAVDDGIDSFARAELSGGGLVRISYESLAAAGIAVHQIDPSRIQVFVDGRATAAYVSTDNTQLVPGDYILFYAPPAGAARQVALGTSDEAEGMGWIYARPARGGDLGVVNADESGFVAFDVDPTVARMMISGFSDSSIWMLDTTDAAHPSILYGQAVVQGGSGNFAVYFTVNPDDVSSGIAVQDDAVIELEEIRGE